MYFNRKQYHVSIDIFITEEVLYGTFFHVLLGRSRTEDRTCHPRLHKPTTAERNYLDNYNKFPEDATRQEDNSIVHSLWWPRRVVNKLTKINVFLQLVLVISLKRNRWFLYLSLIFVYLSEYNDYCNSLLYNIASKDILKLQCIQNSL